LNIDDAGGVVPFEEGVGAVLGEFAYAIFGSAPLDLRFDLAEDGSAGDADDSFDLLSVGLFYFLPVVASGLGEIGCAEVTVTGPYRSVVRVVLAFVLLFIGIIFHGIVACDRGAGWTDDGIEIGLGFVFLEVESGQQVAGHRDVDAVVCDLLNVNVTRGGVFGTFADGTDHMLLGRVWLSPPPQSALFIGLSGYGIRCCGLDDVGCVLVEGLCGEAERSCRQAVGASVQGDLRCRC